MHSSTTGNCLIRVGRLVQLFSVDGGVEIDAFEQGINLSFSLCRSKQSPLCTLAGSAQTPQGTLVPLHVLLVLALELIDKVINHTTVKVFTTQVSVTRSRLDLKDALLDG